MFGPIISHKRLVVHCDNAGIVSMFAPAHVPSLTAVQQHKMQRWQVLFQEYSLDVKHIAGVDNHWADYYSREPQCRIEGALKDAKGGEAVGRILTISDRPRREGRRRVLTDYGVLGGDSNKGDFSARPKRGAPAGQPRTPIRSRGAADHEDTEAARGLTKRRRSGAVSRNYMKNQLMVLPAKEGIDACDLPVQAGGRHLRLRSYLESNQGTPNPEDLEKPSKEDREEMFRRDTREDAVLARRTSPLSTLDLLVVEDEMEESVSLTAIRAVQLDHLQDSEVKGPQGLTFGQGVYKVGDRIWIPEDEILRDNLA